jgi:hypothetical protein
MINGTRKNRICLISLILPRRPEHFSTTTGLWLNEAGMRVACPKVARNSSVLHNIQTGSATHPASYPKGTGGCLSGDKAVVA